jgi:hypothetical protein
MAHPTGPDAALYETSAPWGRGDAGGGAVGRVGGRDPGLGSEWYAGSPSVGPVGFRVGCEASSCQSDRYSVRPLFRAVISSGSRPGCGVGRAVWWIAGSHIQSAPMVPAGQRPLMDATLDALLDAFRRAEGPAPTDPVSFVRGLPEPGALPSPWETWTLIGLVRHRQRQAWVAEIIGKRLGASLPGLAAFGALGHPDGVAQSGSVPGSPEWEYFFHGRGCCLTHKVDGDAIDVDFWDDSADYFDTFFYTRYLESLRRPELPEQRLRDLHPEVRAINIAVADLLAAGALVPFPDRGSHPYRIGEEVLACSAAFDTICTAWPDRDRRVWIAALIGDWLAAHEAAAGRAELEAFTRVRAEKGRELRRCRLRGEIGGPGQAADALVALADLGAPDLDRTLEESLRGAPSGLVSTALKIVEKEGDPRWCPQVYALFTRLDSEGQIPQPYLWLSSLKFLLKHGYKTDELLAALPRAGGTEIGEASLLALEHAPELALPLIRRGLLSDIPANRAEVAALLAVIGRPWSLRELVRALEASDDQEKTADARAALLESGDDGARNAVLAWEERNPHENEPGNYLEIGGRRLGPFYTFGEISLRNRATRIRYEMERLHDRVMRVRQVEPPESLAARPWWRIWKS